MKFALITILTLLAFAGNSILTRMALVDGSIDAANFAAIRLGAGALFLLVIVRGASMKIPKINAISLWAAASLLVYMIGFSFAYLNLNAGLGALILFGVVQITMMIGAALTGKPFRPLQILGGVIAFCGLLILFQPSSTGFSLVSGLLMTLAGIGWGIYSLIGRLSSAPLPATAINFTLAFPIALLIAIFWPYHDAFTLRGVLLAVASGAITSGLGYTLWYSILPKLTPAIAAVLQLSVPILAMIMGAIFLQEHLSLSEVISTALVLSGIAISIWAGRTPVPQHNAS